MSNQVIERKLNGQYEKGSSGNLGGNAQRTRHIFNKAFLEALAAALPQGGARSHRQGPQATACGLHEDLRAFGPEGNAGRVFRRRQEHDR